MRTLLIPLACLIMGLPSISPSRADGEFSNIAYSCSPDLRQAPKPVVEIKSAKVVSSRDAVDCQFVVSCTVPVVKAARAEPPACPVGYAPAALDHPQKCQSTPQVLYQSELMVLNNIAKKKCTAATLVTQFRQSNWCLERQNLFEASQGQFPPPNPGAVIKECLPKLATTKADSYRQFAAFTADPMNTGPTADQTLFAKILGNLQYNAISAIYGRPVSRNVVGGVLTGFPHFITARVQTVKLRNGFWNNIGVSVTFQALDQKTTKLVSTRSGTAQTYGLRQGDNPEPKLNDAIQTATKSAFDLMVADLQKASPRMVVSDGDGGLLTLPPCDCVPETFRNYFRPEWDCRSQKCTANGTPGFLQCTSNGNLTGIWQDWSQQDPQICIDDKNAYRTPYLGPGVYPKCQCQIGDVDRVVIMPDKSCRIEVCSRLPFGTSACNSANGIPTQSPNVGIFDIYHRKEGVAPCPGKAPDERLCDCGWRKGSIGAVLVGNSCFEKYCNGRKFGEDCPGNICTADNEKGETCKRTSYEQGFGSGIFEGFYSMIPRTIDFCTKSTSSSTSSSVSSTSSNSSLNDENTGGGASNSSDASSVSTTSSAASSFSSNASTSASTSPTTDGNTGGGSSTSPGDSTGGGSTSSAFTSSSDTNSGGGSTSSSFTSSTDTNSGGDSTSPGGADSSGSSVGAGVQDCTRPKLEEGLRGFIDALIKAAKDRTTSTWVAGEFVKCGKETWTFTGKISRFSYNTQDNTLTLEVTLDLSKFGAIGAGDTKKGQEVAISPDTTLSDSLIESTTRAAANNALDKLKSAQQ